MTTGVHAGTPLRERLRIEIKVLLVRHNMSAIELAERIGMSQRSMSRRMTGAVPFDVDDLERIAPVFATTPAALLAAAGTTGARPGAQTITLPKTPVTSRPSSGRPIGRPAPRPEREGVRRPARIPRRDLRDAA